MKQALDTRTKLLTKNPWPLMIELSIPAVLGMVVVGLYNMMDSIGILSFNPYQCRFSGNAGRGFCIGTVPRYR